MRNLAWLAAGLPRSAHVSALVIGLAISAPACDGSVTTPDTPALDVPLLPGQVRCGPVTKSSELIGGPLAFGQVGHAYRCYNDKIRFLLQDTERPAGNSSRGGNLIDVDLVRRDETAPGKDAFREHVVAVGAGEADVESIEVIDDGLKSGQGVVRVRGKWNSLTLAPQAFFLAQNLDVTLETDYILDAGATHIEIKTRIINDGDEQIYYPLYADFAAFGGVNKFLVPEFGYGDVEYFSRIEAMASAGDHVSYALACPDEDPLLLFAESRVTGMVCRDDDIIAQEAEYTRFLTVGDGTYESVLGQAYALAERDVGHVSGRITGAPWTYVSAVAGESLDDERAVTKNRTRTDADGQYALTLRPGTYVIVAHDDAGRKSEPANVTVVAGADLTVHAALPEVGTLRLETRFSDGAATDLIRPVKYSVLALDQDAPSAVLGEWTRHGLTRSVPTNGTPAEIELPPGEYEVWASRGFEWSAERAALTVRAGEQTAHAFALARAIDTTGAVATELHQHTIASTDGTVEIVEKVLENAAEGIEMTASTDHDNVADYRPAVTAAGLDDYLFAVNGDEVSFQAIGHFNVYPWQIDPEDPLKDTGTWLWWEKNVPTLFAELRERADDTIIQLNHPRSDTAGLFAAFRTNPVDATRPQRPQSQLPGLPPDIYEHFTNNFDAVEVNGSLGSPGDYTDEGLAEMSALAVSDAGQVPVLADYFAMLGLGLEVSATGNSDTHYRAEGVGYPRNFLFVDKDEPTALTEDDLRVAVRTQHVAVGNGCLAELRVDGTRHMGKREAVTASQLSDVTLRVQSPAWANVTQVELYRNGRIVRVVQDGDTVRVAGSEGSLTATFGDDAPDDLVVTLTDVAPDSDTVYVAVARGPSLPAFAEGSTYCYTAPLYVDHDGDGFVGWFEDSPLVEDDAPAR